MRSTRRSTITARLLSAAALVAAAARTALPALVALPVLLAAVGGVALAHHSGAMFEDTRTLELEGTVTLFDYVNPHSWLYVDVENDDGTVTNWGFELDSPSRLRRIGVSPNHWQPGDRVVVRTRPLKDGRPAGFLVGAAASTGKTFGQANGLSLGD